MNERVKNPIYMAYYSHEKCVCFKIDRELDEMEIDRADNFYPGEEG